MFAEYFVMTLSITQRFVPITFFHLKKWNVLLDNHSILGQIRVLTSVNWTSYGVKCSPTITNTLLWISLQCSNTAKCCTALVPFGTASQSVGEGREKDRQIFQRNPLSFFILNSVPLLFLGESAKNS